MIRPKLKFRDCNALMTVGTLSRGLSSIMNESGSTPSTSLREADEVIKSLFYAGEKPPLMWWSKFVKRLTRAFNAYVKRKGCFIHSDSMNIRIIINKVKADFLTPAN
jgi:hypothetical protein